MMGFNTIPANPFPPSSDKAGGAEYTLPTASADTLGGVKVGSGLTIDGNGVLSGTAYTLPTASADTLGGVKVGANLSIDENGVLSGTAYTLPTASVETLGGVKVGSGLTIADGVLSANSGITVKQKKYTGTGNASNVIDFDNETPLIILGIVPDPDETLITSNYEFVGEIPWGNKVALSYWSTQSGGEPTTGNGGTNLVRVAYNQNEITVTGSSAVAVSNYEGQKYVVNYLA